MIRNTLGHANAAEIAQHLRICESEFVPPLSSRLDITLYADKLFTHAQCFEAWADDTLVGLVAAYFPNRVKEAAFITNVSVLPNWQGLGVATQLMSRCCQQVIEAGFRKIELQVSQGNKIAISFYEKHGFATVKEENGTLNMILDFERNCR